MRNVCSGLFSANKFACTPKLTLADSAPLSRGDVSLSTEGQHAWTPLRQEECNGHQNPDAIASSAHVRIDLRALRASAKKKNIQHKLTALKRPRPLRQVAAMVIAWTLLIAGSTLLTHVWLVPLVLLMAATAQRMLGNALHDAAHGSMVSRKHRWFNRWFVAAPFFEDFENYRRTHLLHHAFLGTSMDPDLVEVPDTVERRFLPLYVWALSRGGTWLRNTFGPMNEISWAARARTLLVWLAIIICVEVTLGPWSGLRLFGLWVVSRGTGYHLLHIFTELSDHVGMSGRGPIGFTRNSPKSLLSFFIHPLNDNYHLTHHLLPRVPTSQLQEAHLVLLELPQYQFACHCDGYFFGTRPVSRSVAGDRGESLRRLIKLGRTPSRAS